MELDERKISLCIPTFNRYELLIDSFMGVLADDRIDEIIISDDASDLSIYDKVKDFVDGIPKVKLYRNAENQDCYKNKKTSITYAKNDYAILLDSDNKISSDYIDKIFNVVNWGGHVAMLPSFAMPHFNYGQYSGRTITKENVHRDMGNPTFTCMLNTMNFFVNREAYLKAWDETVNPNTADSIYMNYRLLNNGGRLYVVPDLTYEHRVDDHRNEQAGHYNTNNHKTGSFYSETEQKLKELR